MSIGTTQLGGKIMAIDWLKHPLKTRETQLVAKMMMKQGMAGYGAFWALNELLANEETHQVEPDYNVLGYRLHCDAGLVKSVATEFGLYVFTEDGEYMHSELVDDWASHIDETSGKRAAAGKRGASKRWQADSKSMASAKQVDSKAMASAKQMHGKAMASDGRLDKTKTKTRQDETKDSLTDGPAKTQNAFGRWQEVWGFPNAVAQQDIADWVDEFGDELVTWVIDYAARRAVQAKAADKYLDRVLTQYREQGIKTVEQAGAEAKAHEQAAKANAPRPQRYGKQARQETTPDWAKPDYKAPDVSVTDDQQAEIQNRLAALKELEASKSD